MCGICGTISYSGKIRKHNVEKMVSTIKHRGPDNSMVEEFVENDYVCNLGHARLSIIDLSSGANQPMSLDDLTIVFNGEIYNYREIRSELISLGHVFMLKSDTEVILHAFKEWGKACVNKFIGMFAFAIYDATKKRISICRDRAGVKPLYYYYDTDTFAFASELKCFLVNPDFPRKIDIAAIDLFMRFQNIPQPYTAFENYHKLDSAHWLEYDITSKKLEITKYWDVQDYYEMPKLDIGYEEAKDELEKLLLSAFQYRMVSDVPVGIFLSAGYDSTLVTSLLQANSSSKLKTFTIGFNEGNNEAVAAKEIARHLGTEHTEQYCSTEEAKSIIPILYNYYDEPFADTSAIPTLLVSKIARQHVTVALSADGGDEAFIGYSSYDSNRRNHKLLSPIPEPLYKTTACLLNYLQYLLPKTSYRRWEMDTLSKMLRRTNKKDLHRDLWQCRLSDSKVWPNKNIFTQDFISHSTIYDEIHLNMNSLEVGPCLDYKDYMNNCVLTKVDRASMAVSLESREPLLDHRIIEFAARLPFEYKYRNGEKKRILKDIVHKYVPKSLIDRPKSGFGVPIDTWLSTDLSYLMEENLSRQSVSHAGIYNVEYVEQLKKAFQNDNKLFAAEVWRVLMFHMWYNKWI